MSRILKVEYVEDAPRIRSNATKAWIECWTKELKQTRIQRWIERIPRHIQKIIALKGGNEYREDREDGIDGDIRLYDKKDRRARYFRAKAGFAKGNSDDSDSDSDKVSIRSYISEAVSHFSDEVEWDEKIFQ